MRLRPQTGAALPREFPLWLGKLAALTLLLLAASESQATPASANTAAGRRDAARCLAQPAIDVCNDAIRRDPSDPVLLVAVGDAEIRVGRAADALRHYRRASDLAPGLHGLAAKSRAAEASLHTKRALAVVGRDSKSMHRPVASIAGANDAALDVAVEAVEKRYSNAAPIAESH